MVLWRTRRADERLDPVYEYTGRSEQRAGVTYYEAVVTEWVWSPIHSRYVERKGKWWTNRPPEPPKGS